jgi:hypothetical protein
MSDNILVDILSKQEQKLPITEWGITQRRRLVEILEQNNINVSDSLYNMLLTHINGLRINESGKVCYLSYYPESKKIMTLLQQNSNIIKKNFNYITRIV